MPQLKIWQELARLFLGLGEIIAQAVKESIDQEEQQTLGGATTGGKKMKDSKTKAAELGVCVQTLRAWAAEGKVPGAIRIGRRWMFSE